VPGGHGLWRSRGHRQEAFDTTIRRLRALVLELDPRPDIITVAHPGKGGSDSGVCEAVAESFARAGHRVVLVRADTQPSDTGLEVKDGLAQAVLYERLNVLELLESSREPMLCVLPAGGFDAQSREFLTSTRLRSVLAPLVEAGNVVVIQSPGLETVEGEAIAAASDLCLVTVTMRRTRASAVSALVNGAAAKGASFAAVVVGRRDAAVRSQLTSGDTHSGTHERKSAQRAPVPFRSRLLRSKR
jgi:Mrp family chromosome partitioning ATPase